VSGRAFLRTALVALGIAAAVFALVRFPWLPTFSLLGRANPVILWAALVVNLSSLLFKGWSWHLLLRRVAPSRWRIAQEANLVGAAVNNISVSVVGEAARIQYVVTRDFLPWGTAFASVVWARAVEAIALGAFLVAASAWLHLPRFLHGVQIGVGLVLVLAIAALAWGRKFPWRRIIPERARGLARTLAEIGGPGRLVLPVLLGMANWGAQWATYHLCLLALRLPVTPEASFTALLVTNLSTVFRVAPGNVGVTQAAMALALLPFGIRAHEAVAGALALQGIQILPVLALGALLVGLRPFVSLIRQTETKPLR